MQERTSYNQRLFASGLLRPYFHNRRYCWLRNELRRLGLRPSSVIELGCFDAKTLNYLPAIPERYLGVDANWEGGLDLGRLLWAGDARVELQFCTRPEGIRLATGERFEIGVAMEVLEYLADDVLENYLRLLSQVIDKYLFVSMPVERGVPFVCRYLARLAIGSKLFTVTVGEFCKLAFGRVSRVSHQGHKGFDDRVLVRRLAQYFDVIKISGLFPGFGSIGMNAELGMLAAPKTSFRPAQPRS